MDNIGKNIPIKNIFYMLCYAWNVLEIKNDFFIGTEKFDNIENLMTRVLSFAVGRLIRKGFNKTYNEKEEEVVGIKGKLNICKSLNNRYYINNKTICVIDNFSENNPFNGIIKYTLKNLLKCNNVDKNQKNEIRKLLLYFKNIDEVIPQTCIRKTLSFDRNNKHYILLLNICFLIYDGLIATDEQGDTHFQDFIRDKQMHKVFELFIYNFYKHNLPSTKYKVYSPKIKWQFDEELNSNTKSLIPDMRTDIVIENKKDNIQFIIDTKYYKETLVKREVGDQEKVISKHLYQILTYLSESDYKGKKLGMLLYPTVNKEIDEKIPFEGKHVHICTLNLYDEWSAIERRLLDFSILVQNNNSLINNI